MSNHEHLDSSSCVQYTLFDIDIDRDLVADAVPLAGIDVPLDASEDRSTYTEQTGGELTYERDVEINDDSAAALARRGLGGLLTLRIAEHVKASVRAGTYTNTRQPTAEELLQAHDVYKQTGQQQLELYDVNFRLNEAKYYPLNKSFGFRSYARDGRPNPTTAMVQARKARNERHRAAMLRHHAEPPEQR